MRIRRFAPLACSLLLAACANAPADPDSSVDNGGMFVANDEQSLKLAEELSLQHLQAQPERLVGVTDYQVRRVRIDELGEAHTRIKQIHHGIPVFGAEAIVHLNTDGSFKDMTDALEHDIQIDLTPVLTPRQALEMAVETMGGWHYVTDEPKVELNIVPHLGTKYLGYKVELEGVNAAEEPTMPIVFVDAHRGRVIWSFDNLETAKNRNTYTAKNRTTLPGTLLRSEGGNPSGDAVADQAHDNAGVTYDYYWNKYGRDSYNGAGATIKSSVHYSKNYVNAFWNGTQMVYGDGNGVDSSALTVLDVVGHELSHAVTSSESNLTYSNESGALNEAFSDIQAAAIELSRDGAVSGNTWKVGEECWTPATAGDALRYMNDPALAGDYDYYPTRYTGTSDNGGVHWNSGIANLAFYLMSAGGTHPRGKTSNVVPALNGGNAVTSLNMAAAIFYKANADYWTPSTNFSGARGDTVAAANALYGATAAAAVAAAWDAVGVPAPKVWSTLATESNQSAGTGATLNFSYATPAGANGMKFETSGGSGDVDLYVKFGSAPTTNSYDCRPYAAGNAESCTFDPSQNGTYYVMLRAYSAFSGVTLKVSSGQ